MPGLRAAPRPHIEPEEHGLGVGAAIGDAWGAQPQSRVDGPCAGAGLGDRIEEGRPVGDMHMFEEAAPHQLGRRQTEQGLAIAADRGRGARTIMRDDDVAHSLGEDAEPFGLKQRRAAAPACAADEDDRAQRRQHRGRDDEDGVVGKPGIGVEKGEGGGCGERGERQSGEAADKGYRRPVETGDPTFEA